MIGTMTLIQELLAGLIPWLVCGGLVGIAAGAAYVRFVLGVAGHENRTGYSILAIIMGCASGLILAMTAGLAVQFGTMADTVYQSVRPAIVSSLNLVQIDADAIPSGKAMDAVNAGLSELVKIGGEWGTSQAELIRTRITAIPGLTEKQISLDEIYRQVRTIVIGKLSRFLPILFASGVLLPVLFVLVMHFALKQDSKDLEEKKKAEQSGYLLL